MSMLDPDQPKPVVMKRRRCVNCGLLIPRNQQENSLQQLSTTMITILKSWITPTELSSESVLCVECMAFLQDRANKFIDEGSALPSRAFGHRSVCVPCGLSILRASNTRTLRSYQRERNILLRNVPLHLVSRMEKVCGACWVAAYREVRRQNQSDTDPSLPDVRMSVEVNVPAPPLSQHTCHPTPARNAAADPLEQSPNASTTKGKKGNVNKSGVTGKTQWSSSDSNLTRVLCAKCDQEVPPSDSASILQGQVKSVIAKVYHFLEREMEYLMSKCSTLDLTPLLDIKQRTAEATGFTQSTITEVLDEEKVWLQEKTGPLRKRKKLDSDQETDREPETPEMATSFLESHDEDTRDAVMTPEMVTVKIEPVDEEAVTSDAPVHTGMRKKHIKKEPDDGGFDVPLSHGGQSTNKDSMQTKNNDGEPSTCFIKTEPDDEESNESTDDGEEEGIMKIEIAEEGFS